MELDFERLSRGGYLTPTTSPGQLVEQYRTLKRSLLKRVLGLRGSSVSRSNPIVVTSALPGEGKTFTAFNLAMSLAMEQDLSVLLVDADLSRRSLSVLTGVESVRGLGDLLSEEKLDPVKMIVRTNVPKLFVIPAGRVQSNATELLSSKRMRRILSDLAGSHSERLILMDSAPVLSTTQGMALCDLAAQILFVVEDGRTPEQAVKDAISQFSDHKAVGLVLNKSLHVRSADYSSYYGEY